MGAIFIMPILAFEIVVESLILCFCLTIPFKESLRFFTAANIASFVAGTPTEMVKAEIYSQLLPNDLSGYFHAYTRVFLIGTALYFIVTVIVEGVVGLVWRAVRGLPSKWTSLLMVIFLANVATYAVVSPIHYFWSRPQWSDINDITPDSSWTSQPDTRFFYLDSETNHLMSIHANGSEKETLVPQPMEEYLLSGDLKWCLYKGVDHHLHSYDIRSGHDTLIWMPKEFTMNDVALSPSGNRVAILEEQGIEQHGVKVFGLRVSDLPSSRKLQVDRLMTTDSDGNSVAWSTQEETLYAKRDIRGGVLIYRITLPDQFDSVANVEEATSVAGIGAFFGRVGRGSGSMGYRFEDHCGELGVFAEMGFGSNISVFEDTGKRSDSYDNRRLFFAVSPGLSYDPNKQLKEVSFLPGCKELLFEVSSGIYLLDIERRVIGKVADGQKHIFFTEGYSKERALLKQFYDWSW
jgi:hypothetical protein